MRHVALTASASLLALAAIGLAATRGGSLIRGAETSLDALDSPEQVDLGEFRYGETAEYAFTIANTSDDAPLTLESIWSPCGCTTTADAPLTLPPGASKQLSGAFSLLDRLPVSLMKPSEGPVPEAYEVDVNIVLGDGAQSRQVRLVARMITPLSIESVKDDESGYALTLHDAYKQRVQGLKVFHASDAEEIAAIEGSDQLQAFRFNAPEGAGTVEAVLRIARDSNDAGSFKLVQIIELPNQSQAISTPERNQP